MKKILLGGMSLSAVIIGVLAKPAVVDAADGIYGIGAGQTASVVADKSYVFNGDGTLTVADGVKIGAGVAGVATDSPEMKWNGTTWESAVGITLGTVVTNKDAVVTAIDGTGTVTIKGEAVDVLTAIDGNVGSNNAAVKAINSSVNGGSRSINGAVYSQNVNINGTGMLDVFGKMVGSSGAGTAVNFSANGSLTLLDTATLGFVTTSRDGFGKLHFMGGGISTETSTAKGLGTADAALSELIITGGAAKLTVGANNTGGIFSKSTDLVAYKMTGGVNLTLGGDSNLGATTFIIDYDDSKDRTYVSSIDAAGTKLTITSMTIDEIYNANLDKGLSKQWGTRGGNSTILVGDAPILKFDTLSNGREIVNFNGTVQTAGGNTFNEASNFKVTSELASWTFAVAQAVGSAGTASLLGIFDGNGISKAVGGNEGNMDSFGGIAKAMSSVVADAGANPVLKGFISTLTTQQASVVAQQMVDVSVNNSISGSINTAAQAADNAISTNIGRSGSGRVASSGLVSGINAGDLTRRNNAWLQAIGSWNNQDRRKGVDGYRADTYGFALGMDTLVAETTRLGVALHYANTNIDGKGVYSRNNAEINTYGITLYGQQELGKAFFLDGRLGYSYNDVSANRYVSGLAGKNEGSYGAHQFNASAKIGYNAKVGSNITLTPHAGLGYAYLNEDGYTENGTAALRIGSRNTDALLIGAGVRGTMEFTTAGKTKIVPELRLGATYDALASSMGTTAQFIGGGTSFISRNVKPDPWTFNVGVGVNVVTSGNLTVSANYDAALRENFAGHTGSLRGKFTF